jgi:hypothetical protein
MESPRSAFKPLVVGAPRSGFTLLSSVVIHFLPLVGRAVDTRQQVLNALLRGLGDHVSRRIVERFAAHGITGDLLFNPNFRYVVGGPKWIPGDRPDKACFRKYIGVRGMGDFTLITQHPREVLQLDEIVHSHTDPALWLQHPAYADFTRFASVRNPVDILNSSIFSLNALASEYIQKFVPPEDDNDLIRQRLALYKFSDMDFFEGLVKFLAGYFEAFAAVHQGYILMRWEDLIGQPVPTILRLAHEAGIPLSPAQAQALWGKLDHVNLTQAHKHNYRVGHGVLDGWKHWMTNHHLRLIRHHGLEAPMRALGYGPIELLDESRYSPFQQQVSALIDAGRVYKDFPDADLFTFAFNKSNLSSEKFPFKRYGWRQHTQIERSIFTDEALQSDIWDAAEQACGELNALLEGYVAESAGRGDDALHGLLDTLQADHRAALGTANGLAYDQAFAQARACLPARAAPAFPAACLTARSNATSPLARLAAGAARPPRLVASELSCNVVEYSGRFYGLPHALGPLDLVRQDVAQLPGVLVSTDREAVHGYAKRFR